MSLSAGDRLAGTRSWRPSEQAAWARPTVRSTRASSARWRSDPAARLVTDADRKRRFLVEAQSAAALSHPRIATVYDVDEVEGLLPGDGTRPRCAADRAAAVWSLPAADALALAVEVGEGLACAHSRGSCTAT